MPYCSALGAVSCCVVARTRALSYRVVACTQPPVATKRKLCCNIKPCRARAGLCRARVRSCGTRCAPCGALLPLAPVCLLGRAPGHARPGLVSRYNLLYCEQDLKMGSSPSQFLPCKFFFFICSIHCKTKIFIFYFSNLPVEPQKLIYLFIYSCFTYCKTNRKKISSIYFFSPRLLEPGKTK